MSFRRPNARQKTFDDMWKVLQMLIQDIFEERASQVRMTEIHSICFSCHLAQWDTMLWNAVSQEVFRLFQIHNGLFGEIDEDDGVSIFSQTMEKVSVFANVLSRCMFFLDENLRKEEKVGLDQLCVGQFFRCACSEDERIFRKFIAFVDKLLLHFILSLESSLHLRTIRSFLENVSPWLLVTAPHPFVANVLGRESQTLEEHLIDRKIITLLEESKDTMRSRLLSQSLSHPMFITLAGDRINEQCNSSALFLPLPVIDELRNTLRSTLLIENLGFLLETRDLAEVEIVSSSLFSHLKEDPTFIQAFQSLCEDMVSDACKDWDKKTKGKCMHDISKVIQFFMAHSNQSLGPRFVSATITGTRKALQKVKTFAHDVAEYIDECMLSSKFDGGSDAFVEKMGYVCNIVPEKDIFLNTYAKLLASRLFSSSRGSAMFDIEKTLFERIKSLFGIAVASPLERMFRDYLTSQSLWEDYREETHQYSSNFVASVVPKNSFPMGSGMGMKETPWFPLLAEAKMFEEWYATKHIKRALHWTFSEGDGRGVLTMGRRVYNVVGGTPQLMVLHVLCRESAVLLKDLTDWFGCDPHYMNVVCKSLAARRRNMKQPLIFMDDHESKSTGSTVLQINLGFASSSRSFSLPRIKKIGHSSREDSHKIRSSRMAVIEAAVMRVLKTRLSSTWQELSQEVAHQIVKHFPLSIPMLKEAMEKLLDKGYIKRNSERVDLYHYVA
eukprot:TRINITY_DN1562_c0_g1_i3.p1 TRINITY_DN1562_c0_g1~~TRINITY_DN1562_c0_g1_i3.p1  ORF type:complete len:725 (+),score=179.37 TRINITY_DN1562_c0_g1_i3:82-2256(+)